MTPKEQLQEQFKHQLVDGDQAVFTVPDGGEDPQNITVPDGYEITRCPSTGEFKFTRTTQEITEADLDGITVPVDQPISEWTDKQVMKAYVSAFSATTRSEVFSTQDVRTELLCEVELEQRNINTRHETDIEFTTHP